MLRIRASKSAQYYEQREFARDDYYSEHERTPGQWLGRGAALLELRGTPEPGELGALLEGQHPTSGEALGRRSASQRNAGFDLTFTAPKSVSVLLSVGDERVRQAVLGAQEAGVRAALDYLEREACYVRRGHAGAEVLRADGFAGAIYHHELARSGDPHLHTHLVMANAARGAGGRWGAPDMRALFAAAKAAGAIREAVLRYELTRTLGLAWRPAARWGYELRDVPEPVLQHFSRRYAEIMELASARDWLTLAGLQAIQRETRDHKPLLVRERAQAEWRARAGRARLRPGRASGPPSPAGHAAGRPPGGARRAAPGRPPGRAHWPDRAGLHLQRPRAHRRPGPGPRPRASRSGA
jgi:conjugative relaxase-like TrwC/TraI family protein